MKTPTQPIDIATVMATPRPVAPEGDGEGWHDWRLYTGPVTGDYVLVRKTMPGSYKPETRESRSTEKYVWVVHTLTVSPSGMYISIDGLKARYLLPHRRHKWEAGRGGVRPEAARQLGGRVGYDGPSAHGRELAFPWEAEVIGDLPVITQEEYEGYEKVVADAKAYDRQVELDKGYERRLGEALAAGKGGGFEGIATRLLRDYPETGSWVTVTYLAKLLDAALEDRRDLLRKLDSIRREAGEPYGMSGSRSELDRQVAEYKVEETDG